eukprot:Gb_06413 [translate_table: standard]
MGAGFYSAVLLVFSVDFWVTWALQPSPSPSLNEHGLSHEKPLEMSPSAVKFFSPDRSPPPAPDQHHSSHQHQLYQHSSSSAPEPSQSSSRLQQSSSHIEDISQGAKVGIAFTVVFFVVFAVGGSYIYVTRRSNIRRANVILPSP